MQFIFFRFSFLSSVHRVLRDTHRIDIDKRKARSHTKTNKAFIILHDFIAKIRNEKVKDKICEKTLKKIFFLILKWEWTVNA